MRSKWNGNMKEKIVQIFTINVSHNIERGIETILITVLRGKTGNDGTKFCSGSSSKSSCTAENILDK